MFENIYGFSCVENQVLAALRNNGYSIALLYNDSAVTIKELFSHFMHELKSPYDFNIIQKIQNVAKTKGYIELKLYKTSFSDLLKEVKNKNNYILIRLKNDFVKNVISARGFRNDHYAYVHTNSNDFIIQNDIPDKTVNIQSFDLEQAYDGEYFNLTIYKKGIVKEAVWNERKYLPDNYIYYDFAEYDIPSENFFVGLRNLSGVYKTLVNRMKEFYSQYKDVSSLNGLIIGIEKIYAICEYYNLRKQQFKPEHKELFVNLINTEKKIMEVLNGKVK